MDNRKGLSDVVTNVLIILLVVVAVGMLWAFVSPMFTRSGEKISQQQACLSMSLEVTKCALGATDATVGVKRSAGVVTLKEIKIIFQKADGSTQVESVVADLPGELETKLYTKTVTGATKVSVAGGIANDKGDVNYCAESQPLNCA